MEALILPVSWRWIRWKHRPHPHHHTPTTTPPDLGLWTDRNRFEDGPLALTRTQLIHAWTSRIHTHTHKRKSICPFLDCPCTFMINFTLGYKSIVLILDSINHSKANIAYNSVLKSFRMLLSPTHAHTHTHTHTHLHWHTDGSQSGHKCCVTPAPCGESGPRLPVKKGDASWLSYLLGRWKGLVCDPKHFTLLQGQPGQCGGAAGGGEVVPPLHTHTNTHIHTHVVRTEEEE